MNFEFSRCISIILKYYYKNIIQNSFWNMIEVPRIQITKYESKLLLLKSRKEN
jgi:hypothetical protein